MSGTQRMAMMAVPISWAIRANRTMRFTSWTMLTDPSWPSASLASTCWRSPTRLLNMAMSSSVMVIWPRPPISININRMICPLQGEGGAGIYHPEAVTLMAEVAVNRALMTVTSTLVAGGLGPETGCQPG